MAISILRKHPGIEVEVDWEELQSPFHKALERLDFSDEWRARYLLSQTPAVVEDKVEVNGEKWDVVFTLRGSTATCFFRVPQDKIGDLDTIVLGAFKSSLQHLLQKALEPYVGAAKTYPIISPEIEQLVEKKIRRMLLSKDVISEIARAVESLVSQKIAELVKRELERRDEEVAAR